MQKTRLMSIRRLARPTTVPKTALERTLTTYAVTRRPILEYTCHQCQTLRHAQSSRIPGRITTGQWQTVRHASKGSLRERLRALQRDSPMMFPAAVFSMLVAATCILAVSYYYVTYILRIDRTFPEPVAKKLKRALYYTNQDVQPIKAWDYYKQALQAADECGLHPFSNEVLGIKLASVQMLERTNHFKQAIEVLEIVRDDSLKYVQWCEGKMQADSDPSTAKSRTRVLAKAIGMCVKLGELYSNMYVDDLDAAERNLVQGVELCLRESQRRETSPSSSSSSSSSSSLADEGDWMSPEEIGGTLEALATLYEQASRHSLAAPLYLRAVTLAQPPSCHTAVLMNNLAASLAQTSPANPPATSGASGTGSAPPPTSRPALISNARQWTEKALQIASSLQPPSRTEECDVACAVAAHNLAEFAEMEGLVAEARKGYEEARALAKAIGFTEGIWNADKGLARLEE